MAAQTMDDEGIRPFISVQGGATRSFLQEGVKRKWAPMGAISLGAYFTPAIGARVQANGWGWNQCNPISERDVKTRFYGGNVDLLFSIFNFVNPRYDRPVNLVLLGGFGLQYVKTKYSQANKVLLDNSEEEVSPNIRLGGQLDVALSHRIGLLVEGGYHLVSNKYGTSGTKQKAWPYVMAGLSYKFGGKKKQHVAPNSAALAQDTYESDLSHSAVAKPVVAEEKAEKAKPAPVVEPQKPAPAKSTQTVSFKLGSSQLDASQQAVVNEVATWAKNHPNATIALTGYADKGTGSAQVNQRISERRAAAVKQELVKRGIPATRIVTDAKGDTIQPFKNNDDNRAVIVIAEEK
ncbi:MAG: OmpA family protein [Prevotella sp.]|nr:OmpA family protein [Prevotella sp.]